MSGDVINPQQYRRMISVLICMCWVSRIGLASNAAIPDHAKEPHVNPTREYAVDQSTDSIDPYTGIVRWNHADLGVPGRGPTIVVQRVYHTIRQIYGDLSDDPYLGSRRPFGSGGEVHFGRVLSTRVQHGTEKDDVVEEVTNRQRVVHERM